MSNAVRVVIDGDGSTLILVDGKVRGFYRDHRTTAEHFGFVAIELDELTAERDALVATMRDADEQANSYGEHRSQLIEDQSREIAKLTAERDRERSVRISCEQKYAAAVAELGSTIAERDALAAKMDQRMFQHSIQLANANQMREERDALAAKLEALPARVAARLMVNGFGERADTLQLYGETGRNLGGWCEEAIVSQVGQAIASEGGDDE